MSVDLELRGLENLMQNLSHLDDAVQVKLVRTATRKAGTIIKERAVLNAPSRTGKLKRAIGVRSNKLRIGFRARVGIDLSKHYAPGKKNLSKQQRGYYGHFVEWGADPHPIEARIRRGGKGYLRLHGGRIVASVEHPGTRATYFMTRAVAATRQSAIDAFAKTIFRGIDRETRKMKQT